MLRIGHCKHFFPILRYLFRDNCCFPEELICHWSFGKLRCRFFDVYYRVQKNDKCKTVCELCTILCCTFHKSVVAIVAILHDMLYFEIFICNFVLWLELINLLIVGKCYFKHINGFDNSSRKNNTDVTQIISCWRLFSSDISERYIGKKSLPPEQVLLCSVTGWHVTLLVLFTERRSRFFI